MGEGAIPRDDAGPWSRLGEVLGADVAAILRRQGADPLTFEGSVRRDADGSIRGGRMNVERPPAELFAALAGALGIPVSSDVERLEAAVTELGLPPIVGVDRSAATVKLYANASDRSSRLRRRLAERMGLEGADASHVIGVNAGRDHVGLKLYRQHGDGVEAAAGLGDLPRALAASTSRRGLAAGAIVSYDVLRRAPLALAPRTLFVALRSGPPERIDSALSWLPGWSADACRRALPFDAQSPCFVGVACDGREIWTAYYKPREVRPPHRIEPVAVFRAEGVEVAIHVEPDRPDRRAYARAGGRAISYRVREGDPRRADVTRLLEWVVASFEAAGGDPGAIALTDPPPPWVPSARLDAQRP